MGEWFEIREVHGTSPNLFDSREVHYFRLELVPYFEETGEVDFFFKLTSNLKRHPRGSKISEIIM